MNGKLLFSITGAVVFIAGVYLLVKRSRAVASTIKAETAVADRTAAQDQAPAVQARHIDIDDYSQKVQ